MKFREWLKWYLYGIPTFEDFMVEEFEKMDKDRKKRGEVWHYICINGHKWKSFSSPTGSFCSDKYGMTETACPDCGSTICKGDVYINGKLTCMGAMHMDFK